MIRKQNSKVCSLIFRIFISLVTTLFGILADMKYFPNKLESHIRHSVTLVNVKSDLTDMAKNA